MNPHDNTFDMSNLPTAIGMMLAFFVALANTNDILNALFMGGVGYGGRSWQGIFTQKSNHI